MLRKIIAGTVLLLLATSVTACRLLIEPVGPGTPSGDDMINTAAAQTVSALGTEIASGRTGTWVPPQKPTIPTVTLTATSKPEITVETQTPTPTNGADCNRASFVKDITIPDWSTILPNSSFTKTWELKNTGTCAWNSKYAVVFAERGLSMSGPASTQLMPDGEVKPGESAWVSVPLRAPNQPGEYESYWMLRSSNNQVFGVDNGGGPFFVKIRVANEYSFAEHYCSAKWSSGAGDLPCPGNDGDKKGYVLQVKNPGLEDNQEREGLGLLAAAQAVGGGYIAGTFPPVIVPDHSDFRATLSCAQGAESCYVRLRVTYRIDNGEEKLLGEWNEGYEGGITEAVKDLDEAAGRSTSFTFYVYVTGNAEQGKAVWFEPRIIKN